MKHFLYQLNDFYYPSNIIYYYICTKNNHHITNLIHNQQWNN